MDALCCTQLHITTLCFTRKLSSLKHFKIGYYGKCNKIEQQWYTVKRVGVVHCGEYTMFWYIITNNFTQRFTIQSWLKNFSLKLFVVQVV